MSNSAYLYGQLLKYLRQYSSYCDLRHLKALSWMVSALICCGKLSLPTWEPYVPSRAQKAQSVERRWSRFMNNERISVTALYVPLVLAALSGWQTHRLYLALDTTVLWNRYCMIHSSGGLLWASHSVAVASVRTRQCNSGVQRVQTAVTESALAVAPSPRCDAVS